MECKRCGHEASSLWNLKNHLNRAKPCPDINHCGKSPSELLDEFTVDKSDWEHECDKCGAKYKSRQGLYYHKKNNKCKVEDVRTHNEASTSTSMVVNSSGNNNNVVVNSAGAVVGNTVNINIIINNFGDETVEYLLNNKEFMDNSIKSTGMINIIDKIYNDDDHPENKTVHSQNKKANTFKIRQNDKWVTAHAQTVIPAMLKKGYEVATKHFGSDPIAVENDIKVGEENGKHPPKQTYFNDLTNPNSTVFKNEYAKTKALAQNY